MGSSRTPKIARFRMGKTLILHVYVTTETISQW